MEALEDRELLAASYLWVAAQAGNWGDQANWRNLDNGNMGVPATGDSVVFNPLLSVGGTQGTNTSSSNNLGSLSLANLTVGSQYNPGIGLELATGLNDTLTITSAASVANGNLYGLGMVKLSNNTTFNWTGGRISHTWLLGSTTETTVTSTFSGTGAKILEGKIFNYGTVSWTQGDLDLKGVLGEGFGGVIDNTSNGVFDIRADASIIGTDGLLANGGTLKKTAGAGTTTIQARFANSDGGQFLLQSGVVKFTGSAYQAAGINSLTQLNGGNLETTFTFYVGGGTLEGVGTITGNIATHVSDDQSQGGTVHPGLGNTPGVLNIIGNFIMGQNGNLSINIDATGNIGLLRVQQNAGQGGNATLDGNLYVTRHFDYTPAVGTTRTFLEYASATGDFFYIGIFNNSWSTDPLVYILAHFEAEKQATSYRLKVFAG